MYLGVSHASHLKKAEFQCSPILGVLLYLCSQPLTQNDQIWRGNTHGEGFIFRRSARPSIPRWRGPIRPKFCGFSAIFAYTV